MRAIYVRICRRWGPRGLTLSAWAWVYAQETGNTRPRNFIDGLWLVLFDAHHHCQSTYQRENRSTDAQKDAPK